MSEQPCPQWGHRWAVCVKAQGLCRFRGLKQGPPPESSGSPWALPSVSSPVPARGLWSGAQSGPLTLGLSLCRVGPGLQGWAGSVAIQGPAREALGGHRLTPSAPVSTGPAADACGNEDLSPRGEGDFLPQVEVGLSLQLTCPSPESCSARLAPAFQRGRRGPGGRVAFPGTCGGQVGLGPPCCLPSGWLPDLAVPLRLPGAWAPAGAGAGEASVFLVSRAGASQNSFTGKGLACSPRLGRAGGASSPAHAAHHPSEHRAVLSAPGG